MRSARMRIAATALTPLLVLGVAACEFGSGGDKKADKKDGAGATAPIAPAASSAAPGAGTGTQAPTSAAPAPGKALTAEQLKAALVTQKELGTGWTVKPGTSGASYAGSRITAVEAACQPFLDLMTLAVPQPAAYAEETLTSKADQGTSTRLDLLRYADDSITKSLDAGLALAAKHDCIEVTATNTKGEKTAYRFDVGDHQPKLGDGALWIDVTWGDEKTMADPDAPTMTSRLQFVRIGSALVRFDSRPDNTSLGAEYIPDAQVKTQVDKLTAALAG